MIKFLNKSIVFNDKEEGQRTLRWSTAVRWQLECHVTPFRRSLPLRHLAEAKTNITLISLIRHNSRLHVNRVTRASNGVHVPPPRRSVKVTTRRAIIVTQLFARCNYYAARAEWPRVNYCAQYIDYCYKHTPFFAALTIDDPSSWHSSRQRFEPRGALLHATRSHPARTGLLQERKDRTLDLAFGKRLEPSHLVYQSHPPFWKRCTTLDRRLKYAPPISSAALALALATRCTSRHVIPCATYLSCKRHHVYIIEKKFCNKSH